MSKKAVAGWIALALLVVAALFYYWTEQFAKLEALEGASGIEIRASNGGVEIVGTTVPDVQVSVDGQSADAVGTQVRIDRKRGHLLVEIDDIPNASVAQVRVPRNASVSVHMGAGELKIEGVEGDIAAVLRAGEMIILVGEPRNLRSAKAFVLSGQLQAPVFQIEKAGVWRMMHWSGPGTGILQAHVTAGHLVIKQK